MYIAIANSIYSSTLQGSGGGFPKACFGLDYNAITSDFTFTRNSFATRVNEFGLIETVTNLGSDLVQNGSFDELGSERVLNGDFENGENDWNFGGDWTLVNGTAEIQSSTQSYLRSDNDRVPLTVKTYKLQYEVITTNGSNLRLAGGSSAFGTITLDSSTVGVKTFYLTSNGTQAYLQINQNAFRGSIDNISLKQVDPNDDWILGSNWSIENNIATADGTQGYLTQTGTPPIGTSGTYKFEWTQEITSGTRFRIFPRNGNDSSQSGVTIVSGSTTGSGSFSTGGNCVGSGTFTAYIETTNGFSVKFLAESGNEGTIDNVSVVEVIEDDVPRIDYTGSTFDIPVLGDELVVNGDFATDTNWVKQSGWSIANGVATFDINDYVSGNTNIYQTCMVVGKEYVLTFDIVDYVQGTLQIASMNGSPQWSGNGTKTVKFIATQTRIFMNASVANNTILNIDNVSIKEVTAYTTTDKGAFLLEPISTNLAIYSEDASQGILSNCTVQSGFVSPSGSLNAYKLIEDNTNSIKLFRAVNNSSTTPDTSYSSSIFVKSDERTKVRVYGYHLANQYFYVDYDLTNNSYLNSGSSNAQVDGYSIEDIGDNGWKRITIIGQKTASYSWDVGVSPLNDNGDVTYLGDGTSGLYIWGAQLEELPYASSYIPTSGTTVTRAQESCLDGTVVANSDEGVLYWEGSSPTDSTVLISELSQGNITNAVRLYYQNGSDSRGAIRVSNVQTTINGGGTLDVTKKIAVVWGNNVVDFWVNGVKVNTDTYVGSIPEGVLTALNFAQVGGAADFIGRTKDLRVYCKALTDDELTELTTI